MTYIDASNIYSESKQVRNVNQLLFAHLEPFAERQYCCINLGLEKLRQVSSDRLHNVLRLCKCWSALACNIGIHVKHCIPYVIFQWIKIR